MVAAPVDLTPVDLSLAELAELAETQAGAIGRDQLAALGVTRHHVRAQVRARRWRLVGRVVVLHRGPLERDTRWWVAVLHAGSGALLCAWTATELYGLEGHERDIVHVVVQHGSRVRSLPWMRVHVSRRLDASDRHPGRVLPVVRPARAVLDAAAWTRNGRAACALALAAVQQRLVRPEDVLAVLDDAGRIRHRKALRRVLLDAQGGAQSLAEIDLGAISRRYGLPEPVLQAVRHDASGRRRYLDGWYKRADGRVVHVEVDGAVHLDPTRWWDDMDRQTDLAIAEDALVVRVAGAALRADGAGFARRLARALGVPITW